LEDYLNYGEYEVCGIAGSVAEAIKLADLHRPDMAIVDYRLGDGTEGSQIRPQLQAKDAMKILYVSADDLRDLLSPEDGEGFIRKPYSIDDLLASVRIVLDLDIGSASAKEFFPKNFYLLGGTAPSVRKLA
jgi:DNA-binding response OmpR family regulator